MRVALSIVIVLVALGAGVLFLGWFNDGGARESELARNVGAYVHASPIPAVSVAVLAALPLVLP